MTTETLTQAPVSFTDRAIEELLVIREQEATPEKPYLRVGTKGGGCSGLTYVLEFDATTEFDQHFELGGLPVVMDKRHGIYLQGMQIDFQYGLNARGFVFQNPNASESCGCGISFKA